MSQTMSELISLYDAAVIAQKELKIDFSGLERMKKPELLSEKRWEDVLEREERLHKNCQQIIYWQGNFIFFQLST